MKEFSYRVRGNRSPYGRQNIYVSCHPQDIGYIDEIAEMVWKEYDCTIWFSAEEPDDLAAYALRLQDMQLMIIPVTAAFLQTPCCARDIDLPFALEHHIPVLPLMLEPGLERAFAGVCGDLHFMDKRACDGTTLTYEQKIRQFLSYVLVNDDTVRDIRAAFAARIFLSYRKKDRALANRLMADIHDIPFCRDIAIWFDEYLTPGEDFNESIETALQNSQLFVLCVTEHLLEEENYIRRIEYPEAKKLDRPIVPVMTTEMDAPSLQQLATLYDGLPPCVGNRNTAQLEERIFENIPRKKPSEEPAHLYLMALAYRSGIEMEITTAAACLASGSDLVIMKHPAAIKTIAQFIDSLM